MKALFFTHAFLVFLITANIILAIQGWRCTGFSLATAANTFAGVVGIITLIITRKD